MDIISDVYFQKLIFTIGALIVTLVLSILIKRLVDILFRGVKPRIGSVRVLAKTRTVRNLFKSAIDFVLLLISVLVIMAQWGINIVPILTGAGILGLAISFGAQSFIKDMIAGFLIIMEDQFSIGDKVIIGKLEGEVYNITLRLTILKDKKGNFVYIPNSQIETVIRLVEKF